MSSSIVNPHNSPLTPLGTAPAVGNVQPMAQPAVPAVQVPGVADRLGNPAMTPPRPAGQGVAERAAAAVQSGLTEGVSPEDLGQYTRTSVNR